MISSWGNKLPSGRTPHAVHPTHGLRTWDATLYDHIRSKDDLLAEVLEHQSSVALRHTARWSARLKPDPEAFVLALFEDLASWMMKAGSAGSGFSRIVMELADLPGHPARKAAGRHKSALETWLAEELASRGVADARIAAQQILILIEGAILLSLTHDDSTYIRVASDAARALLARAGQKHFRTTSSRS